MKLPTAPSFGRQACKHHIATLPEANYIFDDYLEMNIQSGTQWDGLRHYGHRTNGKLYNNLDPAEVFEGRLGARCRDLQVHKFRHTRRDISETVQALGAVSKPSPNTAL